MVTDKSMNFLAQIVSDWPTMSRLIVVLFMCFPFATTIYLAALRDGALMDVYQKEHGMLREAITQSIQASTANAQQLRMNHDLIVDSVQYQQQTCVNTANTQEEKDGCLTRKAWQ